MWSKFFLFPFPFFQTAQSNFHNQKLFEETPTSSLLRSSTYNQRQEQRYLLQAQLEQELSQNQIHQRYLEHRYPVPQPPHRNDYEKLPHTTLLNTKVHQQQKYHSYNPYYQTLNNRVVPSLQTVHTNLNNTSDRFTKQINFNLNNVNHYYNNTKHCSNEKGAGAGTTTTGGGGVTGVVANTHLSSIPTSIGYNTCNNNTIAKTKPYHNNIGSGKKYDNNRNNHNTYIEYYLQKPIKMQSTEIIIEHSQLVLNGNANSNDNTNSTNPMHRNNHYTQVKIKIKIIASLFISHHLCTCRSINSLIEMWYGFDVKYTMRVFVYQSHPRIAWSHNPGKSSKPTTPLYLSIQIAFPHYPFQANDKVM